MHECPVCLGRQDQGLVCASCCDKLETMLSAVPQIIAELDTALAKQAKVGSGGKAGKGSAHERSPVNLGAIKVTDALNVELTRWAVAVWVDSPFDGHPVKLGTASAARVIAGHMNEVRRHPEVPALFYGIAKAVQSAYRLIDRAQDRQYLGTCMYEGDGVTCDAELWARPGAVRVECRLCGYMHNVADRRLDMLEMAQDVICTVKEASSYVGEVGGIRVSQSSIKGYLFRKRLLYVPGTTMIRLGDLLALLADESGRRSA